MDESLPSLTTLAVRLYPLPRASLCFAPACPALFRVLLQARFVCAPSFASASHLIRCLGAFAMLVRGSSRLRAFASSRASAFASVCPGGDSSKNQTKDLSKRRPRAQGHRLGRHRVRGCGNVSTAKSVKALCSIVTNKDRC